MLSIYDLDDLNFAKNGYIPTVFHQRVIAVMVYVRTDTFDKTAMQNWVMKADGDKKYRVCNHHVPHSRIVKAIEDNLLGKTRHAAYEWLLTVIKGLGITPDEYLLRTGNAMTSRPNYDAWVDWAVGSIADWKQNMFYGEGSGDHRGRALDVPTHAGQRKRVEAAAKELVKQIGDRLSLAPLIEDEGLDKDDEGDRIEDEEAAKLEKSMMQEDVNDVDAGLPASKHKKWVRVLSARLPQNETVSQDPTIVYGVDMSKEKFTMTLRSAGKGTTVSGTVGKATKP